MKYSSPTPSRARKASSKAQQIEAAPPAVLAASESGRTTKTQSQDMMRPHWARYIDSRLKQFCTR